MDKQEMIEEFQDQPWGNVLCTVFLIGVGELTGFFLGWVIFS